MRLRTALKICKAVGTPRESAYSDGKINSALRRCERTRSYRESSAFWDSLMKFLGPGGRAELAVRWGQPGKALDILMRHPESEWRGDPSALQKSSERKSTHGPAT
jgi:hypothetical protein